VGGETVVGLARWGGGARREVRGWRGGKARGGDEIHGAQREGEGAAGTTEQGGGAEC
jgi:hypothetical protein